MGRWDAGRRLEASEVLFDFIEECARCALVSHDPRVWCDIRAIRKDEQRFVKTSGDLGGTVDLLLVWDAGMLGVGWKRGIV